MGGPARKRAGKTLVIDSAHVRCEHSARDRRIQTGLHLEQVIRRYPDGLFTQRRELVGKPLEPYDILLIEGEDQLASLRELDIHARLLADDRGQLVI